MGKSVSIQMTIFILFFSKDGMYPALIAVAIYTIYSNWFVTMSAAKEMLVQDPRFQAALCLLQFIGKKHALKNMISLF